MRQDLEARMDSRHITISVIAGSQMQCAQNVGGVVVTSTNHPHTHGWLVVGVGT